MRNLILIALLATTAFTIVAPAADARPLPCEPQAGVGYVIVRCDDIVRGCAWVTLDPNSFYCY